MPASNRGDIPAKILFGLCLLILLGIVVLQLPHSDPVKTTRPAPAASAATQAPPAPVAPSADTPEPTVSAAPSVPEPTTAPLPATPAPTPKTKRPALSSVDRHQQIYVATTAARLAREYALVSSRLNLSADESATLHRLIAEREQANHVTLASGPQGTVTRDSVAEATLLAQSRANRADLESQLQTFLGPDRYAAFHAFEKSIPDRNAVTLLQSRLASTPDVLTDQQQAELETAITSLIGPGHGRTILGRTAAVSDLTVQAAAPFLTPPQLDALAQQAAADQAKLAKSKSGKN